MPDKPKGFFASVNPVDPVIGSVALIVVLAVFAGGLNAALSLLLISIVCTLGAALVIWIPLAIALGALLRVTLSRLAPRAPSTEAPEPPPDLGIKALHRTALRRYAERLGASNTVPADVYAVLKRNGWAVAEIDEAWAEARRSKA